MSRSEIEGAMAERFVTVAAFYEPVEAQLVRGHLEAAGIECFVADQEIVNVNLSYSRAVGGVKVQVKESEGSRGAPRIRDIILFYLSIHSSPSIPTSEPVIPRAAPRLTFHSPLFTWRSKRNTGLGREI